MNETFAASPSSFTASRPRRGASRSMALAFGLWALSSACTPDSTTDDATVTATDASDDTDSASGTSDGGTTVVGEDTATAGATEDGSDSGEPEDRADFAAASPEQVRWAIEVALGLRASEAYALVLQGEVHNEATGGTCPALAYGETTLTLSADGCTTDDGYTYAGIVVADNAVTMRDILQEPTYDPNRPMTLDFTDWSVAGPEGTVQVGGRVWQSSPNAPRYNARSRLVLRSPVGAAAEDISTSCETVDEGRQCQITAGEADVEGLGTFTLSGRVGSGRDRFWGELIVTGRQTLRVDLDTVVDGCHPYFIDGAPAGDICVSASEPPLELRLGYAAGCMDGALRLDGHVDVAVDAMTMEIIGPGIRGVLVAPLRSPTLVEGTYTWTAFPDLGAATWTCDDLAETTLRLIAELGDDRACEVWGPDASAFPPACAAW